MIPLRMAMWQRGREGHPVVPGELIRTLGCRVAIHLDSLHRAPRTRGHPPSIGSVGDAYDNALMETINGLFKAECIRTTVFHAGPYQDHRRHRVRHRRLGRLVQQPQAALDPGIRPTRRVRSTPTTLPSTQSRNPHKSGREPGALQTQADGESIGWGFAG